MTYIQTSRPYTLFSFLPPPQEPLPSPPPSMRDQSLFFLNSAHLGALQPALRTQIARLQTAEDAAIPFLLAQLIINILQPAIEDEEASDLIDQLRSVLEDGGENYEALLAQAHTNLIISEELFRATVAKFIFPEGLEAEAARWVEEFQSLDLQGLQTRRAAISLGILYCRVERPLLLRPNISSVVRSQTIALLDNISTLLRSLLPQCTLIKDWIERCQKYADERALLGKSLEIVIEEAEQIESVNSTQDPFAASIHVNAQRLNECLRLFLEKAK